ncbi:hypothetical protein [Planomicrobium sp. Y74]|uniref:hypothetical protein n=1 Tax=Planomicrobium sp. Y74 TaxID=2478977 RepID=UPI000EF4B517|nr:hypothetical protein [Planomicrobium sp. Y74]RLQ89716.1 hypothetical protein D9754_13010 [Planomicrobium sp. Y74]
MRKESIYIIVLIQIIMTVLLTYDFFSNLFAHSVIPKILVLLIMLILVSVSIFYSRLKINDSKETLVWQLTSTCYLLLLIVIFTMFGGVSKVGISLGSPILWMILFISLIEIYQQRKKLKSASTPINN